MAKYIVKPAFLSKNPNARTQVRGVGVSLNGLEQKILIPGDKNAPTTEKVFRAASQEDLRYLYEEKGMTREIEKVDEPAAAVNKKD